VNKQISSIKANKTSQYNQYQAYLREVAREQARRRAAAEAARKAAAAQNKKTSSGYTYSATTLSLVDLFGRCADLSKKMFNKLSDFSSSSLQIFLRYGSMRLSNEQVNFENLFNTDDLSDMTALDMVKNLPKGWKYTIHNSHGHVYNQSGKMIMRYDSPDGHTLVDHAHLLDENGESLNSDLQVVDETSPDAHMQMKGLDNGGLPDGNYTALGNGEFEASSGDTYGLVGDQMELQSRVR